MKSSIQKGLGSYISLALSGLIAIGVVLYADANIGTVMGIYVVQLFIAALAHGTLVSKAYMQAGSRVKHTDASFKVDGKTSVKERIYTIIITWAVLAIFIFFHGMFSIIVFNFGGPLTDSVSIFVGDRTPQLPEILVASIPFIIHYLAPLFSRKKLGVPEEEKGVILPVIFLFIQLIPLIILVGLGFYIAEGSTKFPLLIFMVLKTISDLYITVIEDRVNSKYSHSSKEGHS